MHNVYDYKRFAILYVDDDGTLLKQFTLKFQEQFSIFTATSAQEGFKVLEQHKDEIGLLMTDQRMPGEHGVWLLEKARQLRPRIIRILVTGYTDMDAAIAAVNTGAIYKYISKPWDNPQLENTLKRGLEFFMVQRERDHLLKEKMSVLHNIMIADRIISLGLLAQGLSHHIRNSLQAVKTFLELAPAKMEEEKMDLNGLRDPDFWREYYRNAQGQLEKINNMLTDLWTASEKPTFEFADRVHLHTVLAETLEQLKEPLAAKGIKTQNRVEASLPPLNVDRRKFYRLFELLLKDEISSLPAGSTITLTAGLFAGSATGQQEIQVQISDDGPGLPKEDLRLVFDPFAVDRSGSLKEYGINLMGCFFIVHHHGGRIDAHSTPGAGTTFTLRLPTNPGQVPPTREEQDFMQKVLLSETLWEKLISSD